MSTLGRERIHQPRCHRCDYRIWGTVHEPEPNAFYYHTSADVCAEIVEAAKEARGRVWDEVHGKVRAVALMLGLRP